MVYHFALAGEIHIFFKEHLDSCILKSLMLFRFCRHYDGKAAEVLGLRGLRVNSKKKKTAEAGQGLWYCLCVPMREKGKL